jgi:hypothetical protein
MVAGSHCKSWNILLMLSIIKQWQSNHRNGPIADPWPGPNDLLGKKFHKASKQTVTNPVLQLFVPVHLQVPSTNGPKLSIKHFLTQRQVF